MTLRFHLKHAFHNGQTLHIPMTTTIVSAPGKVLLAGGYLVLDREYTGLVVATSSRFYCAIRPFPSSTKSTSSPNTSAVSSARISVRAGQFPAEVSIWTYTASASESGLEVVAEGEGKNKFVEITLKNALQVVVESLASDGMSPAQAAQQIVSRIQGEGEGLDVVVLADNDFYSQRESVRAGWTTD